YGYKCYVQLLGKDCPAEKQKQTKDSCSQKVGPEPSWTFYQCNCRDEVQRKSPKYIHVSGCSIVIGKKPEHEQQNANRTRYTKQNSIQPVRQTLLAKIKERDRCNQKSNN